MEFEAEAVLPSGVRGPVEDWALAWLASICAGDVIVECSMFRNAEGRLSQDGNGRPFHFRLWHGLLRLGRRVFRRDGVSGGL